MTRLTRPWAWALIGLAAPSMGLAWDVGRRLGGDVSGLYLVTEERFDVSYLRHVYRKQDVRFSEGPYDCYYFLSMANDPLLTRHKGDPTFDLFYRGKRIFWPWVGYVLGLGRPRLILFAMPLAQLALLGLTLGCLAQALAERGRHPGWSLLYALSLGTTVCLIRPLSDLFATNLLLLASWCLVRRRHGAASVLLAAACLTKETSLTFPLVFSAAYLLRGDWRTALLVLGVPCLACANWWAWLLELSYLSLGGAVCFGPPLAALGPRLAQPLPLSRADELVALYATAASVACAFLAGRRSWDVWRVALAVPAAMAVASTMVIWVEYWSYGRAYMTVPAFLLWRYALTGRRMDLVGPAASAAAGCVAWAFHLGVFGR